jgi:hypothetical protein
MDGQQLRDLIGQKRPQYKEQYRTLIDSISKRAIQAAKAIFRLSVRFTKLICMPS